MKRFLEIGRILITPVAAAAVAGAVIYYAVSAYVVREAKKNIANVFLTQRAFHHYIQRDMHPTFFKARDTGYITQNYYSPEIFSSSFIVRVMHKYYNEERKKKGLHDIYYKMAAENPRNIANKGDEHEIALLKMFNERRDLKEYEEIMSIDNRRFLFYAIPFLETNKACLRCHGERSDAPPGLQAKYPGQGGFGDKVGNIRAIECLRMPIDDELSSAYIIAGSSTAGTLAFIFLVVFNKRLRKLVRKQTEHLEIEVRDHKKAEENVRLSLKEKEVLLQEVHHRVKNNMAIISSFLELNMMFMNDDKTTVVFQECLQRIKSMALVHEKLYHSKNLRDISVRDYVTDMVDDLIISFVSDQDAIVRNYAIDDIYMTLDNLIPLGLIINEVVANSLKHARGGPGKLEIGIRITLGGEGKVKLVISDNGPGLPDDSELAGKKTLGLEIIKALVGQLKGIMEIERRGGTAYVIDFPINGRKNGKV